ncbi:MAG: hypothetical protein HY889_02940 [Deltaproteobacteria bacterium]|nr:hypothetical protein [Deltaproteobacteria bacterium]
MAKRYFIALFFVLAVPAVSFGVQAEIKLDDKIASMHKAGVGPVIFPHAKHEKVYKCNDCHPKIFSEKRTENNISMKFNMEGKYCGSANCHNSPKAFALFECARCHTGVPGAKK